MSGVAHRWRGGGEDAVLQIRTGEGAALIDEHQPNVHHGARTDPIGDKQRKLQGQVKIAVEKVRARAGVTDPRIG